MTSLTDRKNELRQRLRKERNDYYDKEAASKLICDKLQSHPDFRSAQTVRLYVSARSEVRTHDLIQQELGGRKRIVIPFCQGDELVPWELREWSELAPGAFGILEPHDELRTASGRLVAPEDVDLICIPGIVFDRAGNRLGSGRGFYDRLLPQLREDAIKIALAYECQIVAEMPVERHDIPVDIVVTQAS